MITLFGNLLRDAQRDGNVEQRATNPPAWMWWLGGAAVISLGVGGYVAWRHHAKPAAPAPGGGGGGGDDLPDEPGDEPMEPSDAIVESFTTPYSNGTVSYTPNNEKPYTVAFEFNTGDTGAFSPEPAAFDNKDDAIAYAKVFQWYFGRPKDADDIYVGAQWVGWFDDSPRGAIWQSVTLGTFYYSIWDGTDLSTFGSYAGIDQAGAALHDALQDAANA